jgi:hypothetical protein
MSICEPRVSETSRGTDQQFNPQRGCWNALPLLQTESAFRAKWAAHALTFVMVFEPGLIVMKADNHAMRLKKRWIQRILARCTEPEQCNCVCSPYAATCC